MTLREKNLLGLLAVVVAAMPLSFYLALGGEWQWWRGGMTIWEEATAEAAKPVYLSQLDGARVKKKSDQARQVAAVMIDNHPDSQPPFGLSQARVVYEVPVEGGLTRYMALFDITQQLAKVGPVRSARPYFLDWLWEYGKPLYMHSGGSPEALKQIKIQAIFDADEFSRSLAYWRDKNRLAPHNLFTSSTAWQKLSKESAKPLFPLTPQASWKFAATAGAPLKSGITKEVAIPYAPDYTVSWRFDPKRQDYARYINGVSQLDGDKKEIRAANVLIQSVGITVLDDVGRLEITTEGTGAARILKKGQAIAGTWNKPHGKRTRFYSQNKKEIVLLPGKTWVEVVPQGMVMQITQ